MVVINMAVDFLSYQILNTYFLGPFFVLRIHRREVFFVREMLLMVVEVLLGVVFCFKIRYLG